MPITQARVIAIINAGLDYQQALDKAIAKVSTEVRRVLAKQISAQEAISEISVFCERQWLLLDEASSFATLSMERSHFKSHMKKNESAAKWQREYRRRMGVPAREDTSQELFIYNPHDPRLGVSSRQDREVKEVKTTSEKPNLAYDTTDPENAFAADGSLDFGGGLDSVHQRQIDIEFAPPEHRPSIRAGATSAEDLFSCPCGLQGSYEDWKKHLEGIGNGLE